VVGFSTQHIRVLLFIEMTIQEQQWKE